MEVSYLDLGEPILNFLQKISLNWNLHSPFGDLEKRHVRKFIQTLLKLS